MELDLLLKRIITRSVLSHLSLSLSLSLITKKELAKGLSR
jgi:hypothetical protein